jgi:hypothetical protein
MTNPPQTFTDVYTQELVKYPEQPLEVYHPSSDKS